MPCTHMHTRSLSLSLSLFLSLSLSRCVRDIERASLQRIINTIFTQNPDLHYIQGHSERERAHRHTQRERQTERDRERETERDKKRALTRSLCLSSLSESLTPFSHR